MRPSFAKGNPTTSLKKEGGGAPKGASNQPRQGKAALPPLHPSSRRASLFSFLPRLRGRVGEGARSPLGAPPQLWSQRERFDPIQAALHASERMRALPAPSFALKRGTSRTGHNAGGDDARTARERGYKPRPQEPHSLHVQVCLENTPFDERDWGRVIVTGTNVKSHVSINVTSLPRSSWPDLFRPSTAFQSAS